MNRAVQRTSAAGAVAWTASSQAIRQLIQIALTAVLARCLMPDEFGLMGMAAVTLASVAPLNEMGMGAALVQKRELLAGHASTVFWAQTATASAAAALLWAAAPLVAAFFQRDDLVPLVRWMCLILPLGAAASAPQALLSRSMRFDLLAGLETASLLLGGAAGVAMALSGWGVWSLVGQALVGGGATLAMALPMSGLRPLSRSGRPRLAHLRDLASFSGPLSAYQILNFISRNLDDVLIGRFLGAQALGYYSMAYRVMMYPLQKVSGIVGRVSFPAFAAMQDDLPRIRRGYLRAVQFIALVTFPMMAIVAVAAPHLTGALFGASWGPAAPLITVLSLAGITGSIGTTVGSLFLARGRSDLMLRWEIAATAVYTAAIFCGLAWGLMGVAIFYTAAALILWPISHAVANRLIELPMADFLGVLKGPAIMASILAAALLVLRLAWAPGTQSGQAAFLAACALAGAAAYGIALWLGRPAAVVEMLALVRRSLPGHAPPVEAGSDNGVA